MRNFAKYFPWLAAGVALVYLARPMVTHHDAGGKAEFNLEGYAQLPVLDGGRFKPIDTVARMNLMIISGKQTFFEEHGKGEDKYEVRQPAIKWLLDCMTCFVEGGGFQGPAMDHKVFRIENEEVLQLLKLEPRSGFRYSVNEFRNGFKLLMDKAKDLDEHKDKKSYDLYDAKVVELANHLGLFQQLAFLKAPLMVMLPGADKENWFPLEEFIPPNVAMEDLKRIPSAGLHYILLRSYAENDPQTFNKVLQQANQMLGRDLPPAARKAGFEIFYNHFEPFFHAAVLYAFAFVLGCFSWMGWFRPLNRAAFALTALAFAAHTFGLFARMYIQDRNLVFVTNLYSSAIFIGWGCVGVCMFIEYFYRNSIAVVVGSATAGISAGIIAHYLSLSGDTMEMMQAVLDTNFWLATHVTTVTLGYTATFVAGFLGIAYIFLGVFTPFLNRKLEDIFAGDDTATGLFRGEVLGSVISKMTYGVLCFALLLSFVGTVLGGIWADQSWGRFWGWDPKENGALLIVIWNAVILHARWGGMAKARGVATLAVAGNIVTSWSWFGTNLLGVGLHAYGGGGPLSTAVIWLFVFVGSQFLIIGMGCIPVKYWLSFMPLPQAQSKPSATKPSPLASAAMPT